MHKGMAPTRETQVRFLRFLTVGGVAALVQFSTLAVYKRWLAADIAFSCSFFCSTATHYLMNRFWALPSDRRDSWRQFGEYVGTAALSYLVNLGLFKAGHDLLGLRVLFAAALALPPSTLLVFLLLNYRVFRRKSHLQP